MNRLINYIKINLPNDKIKHTFIITLVVFVFYRYIFFMQNSFMQNQNIYDLFISVYSNILVVGYFMFIIFLVFIYNIAVKNDFNKYLFCRFSTINKWYTYNIFTILILSIIFVVITYVICILEGVLTLDLANKWSAYSVYVGSGNSPITIYNSEVFSFISSTISPFVYVVINSIYFTMYIFIIGSIFFVLNIILKNKILSILSTIIINYINIMAYNSDIYLFRKYSFFNNIIILGQTDGGDISTLFSPLIYWCILSSIIYFLGEKLIRKSDLKFGENI